MILKGMGSGSLLTFFISLVSFTGSGWVCAKITVFEQLGLPEAPKKPLAPYLKFITSVKHEELTLSGVGGELISC